MEAWSGKVAVVTGASSGIGAAICKTLCKKNVTVVGMARRLGRLNLLHTEILTASKSAKFHSILCDLTKEDDIKSAFAEVLKKYGGVDILINNAGIVGNRSILGEGGEDHFNKIIQTNLTAVLSCTKKAYDSMVARDVPGYIITVSSVVGHYIPFITTGEPTLNVYPCSKFAITALNHVLRMELNFYKQNKIRVSNISPGSVKTEVLEAAGINVQFPEWFPILQPEDIADAITYILSTPSRVQIQDIIIKPTGEMF